jgi:hypothetical protein
MPKIKIRENMFETNSSSVHTLVIANNGGIKFDKDVDLKDGVLRIKCGNFSEDQKVEGQKRKLEYLGTIIYLYDRWNQYGRKILETDDPDCPWLLNDLFRTMQKQLPEVRKIIITDLDKASMDQRYADYDGVVNMTDDASLVSFIFNDSISVDIWHD